MNVADGIAFSFILVGTVGLLFVAFLRIHGKLLKHFYVHYENLDGNHSYVEVIACSRVGAVKKAALLHPEIYRITRVWRDRG